MGEPAHQRQIHRTEYQAIIDASIPAVNLPDEAGTLRVIAGDYAGHTGPAHTFTPIQVWNMRLKQGKSAKLSLPEGWNTLLIVLHGTVMVNGSKLAREAQLVVFDRPGTTLRIEANNDATLLLLNGEPIVGYGPFMMNSEQEIAQAISDFNSGHFGQIPR